MTDSIESSRSPNLVEVLQAAMDQAVGDVYSMLPGKVESYDAIRQVANIKPLVKRRFVDGDGEEDADTLPILPEVPVLFPRGGGYFLSFPLAKGDNVMLIFADRSIDDYMYSSGGVDTDPVDLRKHDISDAVALPTFFPNLKGIKDVIATGAVFGKEKGPQVRAGASAIEITTGGAPASTGGYTAMALLVEAQMTALKAAIAGAAVLATDGGATFKANILAALTAASWPTTTASRNLKAD